MLTVKIKNSSMNMAPNGRMPAINVLKSTKHFLCMSEEFNSYFNSRFSKLVVCGLLAIGVFHNHR